MNWFDKLVKKYYRGTDDFVNVLTKSNKVKDLKIKGNTVSARVILENESHSCEIRFNEFSSDEKSILNELAEKPINMYRLNNGIFPDEFSDCGVKIFPDCLDDLDVTCSCDEDSGICSDAVHVLQVLSKMMIEDSFLIFSLRGLDLKRDKFPIKSVDEIFVHDFKREDNIFGADFKNLNAALLKGEGLETIYAEIFRELDNESLNLIMSGYSEYINFRHFKKPNAYKRDLDFFREKWDDIKNLSLDVDSNYRFGSVGYIQHPRALFAYLMEMGQFDYSSFDENLCFWIDLLKLTFRLLGDYAIVPQIFSLANGNLKTRWIPAFYDGNVVNECSDYYHDCPGRLVTYNGKKISKENQVIIAVSLLMQGFIDYYRHKHGVYIFKRYLPDLVFELLFEESFDPYSDYRRDIACRVGEKLSVFEMKGLKFQYILTLRDGFEGMFLELTVKRGKKQIGLEDARLEELIYVKNIYDLFTRFGIRNRLCEKIFLTPDEYLTFKKSIKFLLKFLNVKYDVSFEIQEVGLKLKLDLKIDEDSYFSFNSLKDYEWKVIIGDDVISLDEFNRISKNLDSLVKINDNYYTVDRARVTSFQSDTIFLPRNLESNELLQISLLERYRNIKFEADSKIKEFIDVSNVIDNPSTLNGELRPYQKVGVSWLLQNVKSGFGSILADDMGLGKTVQVLACILHLKENDQLNNQQVLIIAPTTLVSNWQREIEKFAPTLTYSVYHGDNRKISRGVDVILTSFAMLRSDVSKFKRKRWFMCVVDEAQNIKNPKTQQTKAVKSIKAFNKIALTGTPIENRLLDYWSIFDFTNPEYLFSQSKFRKEFVTPIEKNSNGAALSNLKKITKPFILRRLKSDKDIINDLPEKNVNDIYCNLTSDQAKLYDKTMDEIFADLKALKGINRRGVILKLITHLKQICNHPAQYLKSNDPQVSESGKLELLMEILENILDVDEKVIIFTQYVQMGEILQELILKRFNNEVLFLHGSLSVKAREKLLDDFQNDSHYPVLIATLKTGGVGLNLTAARNVIHYDLWWNPAVENQATDRAYRIGQKKDVMVYRFITKGTLEENIDLMIKDKLELAGRAIDSEETFITEMSDEELLELLSLR